MSGMIKGAPMYRLAYVSTARHAVTSSELQDILEEPVSIVAEQPIVTEPIVTGTIVAILVCARDACALPTAFAIQTFVE